MNVLNQTVLVLNSAWQAVNQITVEKALGMLSTDVATALNFVGEDNYGPVTWAEWLELPCREGDGVIHTPNRSVRAPTVIVAVNYAKCPKRRKPLRRNTVAERDNFTCQYCAKTLPISQLNVDHVTPQMLGGRTTWENVVASCIPCNSAKGHKTVAEFGRKPMRKPFAPLELPVSATLRPEHPHHHHFLNVR